MAHNKEMQIDYEQLKIKTAEYQKIIEENEIPQIKEELNTLNTKITKRLLNASKKIAIKGNKTNLIEKRPQLQGDRTSNGIEIAEQQKQD